MKMTQEEINELLDNSLEGNHYFVNLELKDANFFGSLNSGSDFTNAILPNASFITAKLEGANFTNANLQGAKFYEATLFDADFTGANLEGAHFMGAFLDNAVLERAHAKEAQFFKSTLFEANCKDIDLTDANLMAASCMRADFERANFFGVDTRDTDFMEANLINSNINLFQLKNCGILLNAKLPDFRNQIRNRSKSNGFVYILTNAAFQKDMYKIGKTTRTPDERATELSSVTGVPSRFSVIYQEEVVDCNLAETLIHERLSSYRVQENREFFELPLQEAIRVMAEVAQEIGRGHMGNTIEAYTSAEAIARFHQELCRICGKLTGSMHGIYCSAHMPDENALPC